MSEPNTTMTLTDQNHVETINGLNTHRPIFKGSDGLEYYRTKDGKYHPLTNLNQGRQRREKDKHRVSHDVPVEAKHLPRNLKQQ